MERILRAIPFGLSLVFLALAIVGMRWALGCPNKGRAAENVRYVSGVRDREPAPLREPSRLRPLAANEPADDLLTPPQPMPVMLASENVPAADAAASSGPELLPSPPEKEAVKTETPTELPVETPAKMLSEMPKAEPPPSDPKELAETDPEAMSSPLAAVETSGPRSPQLERVARQADRQTRHGLELAGRGAFFAARSELLGALRLIAEGLDTERKSDAHGRALASALTAMKEAEDFLPLGSRLEADLDLPRLIGSHATPVLKDRADGLTPIVVLRSYLTFAQEQFSAAVGHEVAGSMTLHAMGKLHTALAKKKNFAIVAAESKAVVFFQAALLVYPENYMAANDLGVLLAQCGNGADARGMLAYSVSLHREAANLRNLAIVYRQLGQSSLAEQADRQATLLVRTDSSSRRISPTANASVQWIDPQSFAQTSGSSPNPLTVTPQTPEPTPAVAMRNMPDARRAATQPPTRAVSQTPPGAQPATPTIRTPSNGGAPAPTPAAAARMSWGVSEYPR